MNMGSRRMILGIGESTKHLDKFEVGAFEEPITAPSETRRASENQKLRPSVNSEEVVRLAFKIPLLRWKVIRSIERTRK